ncbi:MAG: hypothetical protein AAGC64_12290 [Bacteroidota bacterium]
MEWVETQFATTPRSSSFVNWKPYHRICNPNGGGKASQSHHVFPQKSSGQFQKLGINVNDPKFGTWWETTSHLRNARGYNTAWEAFFSGSPTRQGAFDLGRQLMQQNGIPVGF